MKKLLIASAAVLTAVSLSGCMTSGQKLEGVSTKDTPDVESVKVSDYENNLDGLEKYFIALKYIPEKADSTEMMYNVIGAVDGNRYNFKVNNSAVTVELYEYEPDNLGEEGKRVINEVQSKGEFYVFDESTELNGNVAYPATLSDNGKYLMIYTDPSTDEANVKRASDVKATLKAFYR